MAQSVYVSDQFQITLRENPAQNASINAMLPSGAKLEVLETTEHWLRVRTSDGRTGWILKRFAMDRLPRAQIIERLQERIADLEQSNSGARETIEKLREARNRLDAKLKSTNQTLSRIRREYQELREDAPRLPEIKNELQETRNRLQNSLARTEELKEKNEALRSRHSQLWFLVGAGVVFVSCLIGFILGRLRRKKSRSVFI
jgi:SH3 domain protein